MGEREMGRGGEDGGPLSGSLSLQPLVPLSPCPLVPLSLFLKLSGHSEPFTKTHACRWSLQSWVTKVVTADFAESQPAQVSRCRAIARQNPSDLMHVDSEQLSSR